VTSLKAINSVEGNMTSLKAINSVEGNMTSLKVINFPKLSPEDAELNENFDQIHKSNREKVIFRNRILSKIKNQVEKNRYETIQTLMNNFLKLG
jgi:hypothetical protein